MSQGFLQGLVDWLAVDCALPIAIAQTGERPHAGTVYFPPEGRHLKFDADGQFLVADGPKVDDHFPSVTVTFQSAAYRFGRHVIGVLLTGMGQDGVDGMLAIVEQGGVTIAQNEQSCVVFGMPQRAIEVKAVSHILPLQDIASMLISTVVR
jgi:two-component system chemotaxis response regulator CheB